MAKRKTIVMVAAYSPIGSCDQPHLGASNKIRSVLRIISRFGYRVILINSAHNNQFFSSALVERKKIDDDLPIATITPFTLNFRPLGKLLNIVFSKSLARRVAKENPVLIWIYNGYAFESKFVMEIKSLCECPVILELEDWPLARRRGYFNIKPRLDFFYFKKVIPKVELITCVNRHLQFEKILSGKKTILFPSTLNQYLFYAPRKDPFSHQPYTLGYFGGLTKEKGADVLLEVIKILPENWKVSVTGSGPLVQEFKIVAENYPDKFRFVPKASEEQLYEMIMNCDVIVNPHKTISQMDNGIFPFKVFEAIASGRLLISTELPPCGIEISGKVMFFDGSPENLVEKLLISPEHYRKATSEILRLSDEVKGIYSEDSLFHQLENLLPHLGL